MALGSTGAHARDNAALRQIDEQIDASAVPDKALALARRQAEDGNISTAVATLERVLMHHPREDTVRFYLVALLCRLDSRAAARRQLGELAYPKADSPARAEATAACAPRPPAPHRSSAADTNGTRGRLSAALMVDSDLENELKTRLDLPNAVSRQGGLSLGAEVELAHRMALGKHDFIVTGLSGQLKEALAGPSSGYEIGGLRLGYGFVRSGVRLTASGTYQHVWLNGDSLLDEYGGQLQVAVRTGARTRLAMTADIVHQQFTSSSGVPRPLDGERYGMRANFILQPRPGTLLSFGAGLQYKDARGRTNSYLAPLVSAEAQFPLNRAGLYARASLRFRRVFYEAEAGSGRRESQFGGQFVLGKQIAGPRLAIEATARYGSRIYNAASGLANYHNATGELRIIWRFGR